MNMSLSRLLRLNGVQGLFFLGQLLTNFKMPLASEETRSPLSFGALFAVSVQNPSVVHSGTISSV
jgi:hypothetical protein